jgi:nitric-oxide synthase, bacterial
MVLQSPAAETAGGRPPRGAFHAEDGGEVAVGLSLGRGRPDSRRGIPGRGSRGRGRGAEPVALGSFQACPVAVDEPATGYETGGLDAVRKEHSVPVADWASESAAAESGPGDDALAGAGLLASADRFITQFHDENRAGPPDRRLRQVRREIEATGTYRHTPAELTFGARVAWRNSAKCIGRLYWHSLRVRDRREVTAAADIAAESVMHLREATNGGRIRPVITVFAPDAPGRPGPRILSSELVRYAGHPAADGAVTGDPATAGVTRLARDLGWPGGQPPGRFDVLPLIVQEAGSLPTLHELPPDAVLEVPIRHPEFGWFADLGLRWYAVPVISDMYLDVGGIRYPAAPFNGWYMCTEIGSRDLGDTARYDQLPVIARQMGLSVASDRTLWKDKAITELNLAVLHSYAAAGVTISDHHTESVRFLQHVEREERQGRACPADWSWIVPPAASSATPVFHRTYTDFDQSPNFYRHPAAAALTTAAPSGDRAAAGPAASCPWPG